MGERRKGKVKTSSMRPRRLFEESFFHTNSPKRETSFYYKTTSPIWRSGVVYWLLGERYRARVPALVRSLVKRMLADCQEECASHQYHITVGVWYRVIDSRESYQILIISGPFTRNAVNCVIAGYAHYFIFELILSLRTYKTWLLQITSAILNIF